MGKIMKKLTTLLILSAITIILAANHKPVELYPHRTKAYSCLTKIKSEFAGDAWFEMQKTENNYTGELLSRSNSFNNSGTGWELSDYTVYTYNAQNQPVQKVLTYADGTNYKKEIISWENGHNTAVDYYTYSTTDAVWKSTGRMTASYSNDGRLINQKTDVKEDLMGSAYIYIKKHVDYTYESGALTRAYADCGIAMGDSSQMENFLTISEYGYKNNRPQLVVTKGGESEAAMFEFQWDTLSFNGNTMTRVTRELEEDSTKLTRLTAQLDNAHNQFNDEFQCELPLFTTELNEIYTGGNWLPTTKYSYTFGETAIAEVQSRDLKITAYPNPFNPQTTITFTMPDQNSVNLGVYNAKGELVSTLFKGQLQSGSHNFAFDGAKLNSGVYFYRLTCQNNITTGKILLVK